MKEFSRFVFLTRIDILLWSIWILFSNSFRLETDRGLTILVSGIILVTRDEVGEKVDRVGLFI
jgi:hypothetical protein